MNVARGSAATVREIVEAVEELAGLEVPLQRVAEQPGDVYRTGGATEVIEELLRWKPEVGLREGLRRQFDWHAVR